MRLAILTSWYPTKMSPLYGIFVEVQAKGLATRNFVDVLLLKRSLISRIEIESDGQLTIYRKSCLYLPNLNEILLKIWAHQYYLLFKKLNKKHNYNIIHCHDHYGAYAGWYINKKLGIPYIVTIHNSSIQNMELLDWKKAYLPKILDNAQEVLAVGKKLSSILENNFTSKKIIILPNVIDNDIFKPSFEDKPISPFKFLFIGDLDENKGVMRLLQAYIGLENKNSQIQIIGRGPLKEQVQDFISTHNLSRHITISEKIANNELPFYYNSCHAYISLSHQETFGITILEAMSCGLPIIYTKSGGPEDIIAPHGCFATSKTDIIQISSTMDKIIENYSEINRIEIRKHVIENYSSQSIINKLNQIYKSHINEV